MNPAIRTLRVALAAATLAAVGPARATLGEPEATVARDGQALAMSRQPSSSSGGVSVHELRTATLGVREYTNPAGTVFAVTWSGLAMPDLGPLLGTYHQEYRDAAAQRAPGRGPRRVEAARVVVETWGHARSLHGRAYLPTLVPQGVSLDDIQ